MGAEPDERGASALNPQPLPILRNGTLTPGDEDCVRFDLTARTRLVFEALSAQPIHWRLWRGELADVEVFFDAEAVGGFRRSDYFASYDPGRYTLCVRIPSLAPSARYDLSVAAYPATP